MPGARTIGLADGWCLLGEDVPGFGQDVAVQHSGCLHVHLLLVELGNGVVSRALHRHAVAAVLLGQWQSLDAGTALLLLGDVALGLFIRFEGGWCTIC